MQGFQLQARSKIVISVRILIQIVFILYLIFAKEDFQNLAAFLVAIIAAEGYKLLGAVAISQNSRFRDLIGLVTGVLNGMIFMITLYLTGFVQTELWMFALLSVALTALEYGIYGAVAESLVMMSLYVVIGGIESMDYSILLIRAFVTILVSAIYGYISNRELVFEKRFQELEKMSKLTKDQKSRFIGLISHSLRTPITTIRGYVDLLVNERAGKLKKEQMELVEKLKEETSELQDLTEDFLTISTLEKEHIQLDFSEFDICGLCKEVYEEMTPRAKEKGITFKYEDKSSQCSYEGERSKLENAIKNLIDNAIKFTPQDGTVTLSLYNDTDYVYIDVHDTGVGIPQKEQKDLFGMFSRATNILKYEYKGVGLGLYMSRLIVEAHGGRIELESEEGVGSKFSIILPTGKLGKVIRKISGK